jgi:hypothetical protein
MEARLQKRKNGEDGLAVGIVEEAYDPEDGDKQPAIGRITKLLFQITIYVSFF